MDGVFPQVVFSLFGIPIRDTVITTWIMIGLILAGVLVLRRRFPAALEQFIDFVDSAVSDVLGVPAGPYLPFLGTLMLFIAMANSMGVLPFFATPTKDINMPLALALVVFMAVHYFGVRALGAWGYIKKYLTPLAILDVIGQFSRTMSLTLRLFGNVISSEIVVAVIFMLFPPVAPLPMMGLGLFSGVLQAYIFTILATSYIATAVEE